MSTLVRCVGYMSAEWKALDLDGWVTVFVDDENVAFMHRGE